MINIELSNFQDSAVCRSLLHSSIEGFVEISCSLHGGNVYAFISDFGCGSWGLATCLGGRCTDPHGTIYGNGESINPSDLIEHSCFISEYCVRGVNDDDHPMTVRECIEKALAISKLPYTTQEIKQWFYLSDERFDRDIKFASGEIWNISAAVGFAADKKVFCFPWLNERELFRANVMHEIGVLSLMKSKKRVVLIPTSHEKEIRRICDAMILFGQKGHYVMKQYK